MRSGPSSAARLGTARIARAAVAAAIMETSRMETSPGAPLIWGAAAPPKALRPRGHTPRLIAGARVRDGRPSAKLNDISSFGSEHPSGARFGNHTGGRQDRPQRVNGFV